MFKGLFGCVIFLNCILLFFIIFKIVNTEKILLFEIIFGWFKEPETKLKKFE